MLFCNIDLASRVERAECRLLTEGACAMRRNNPKADVMITPIAGGVAVFTGTEAPSSKLAGIGFCGNIVESEFADIESAWHQRGSALQVELSTLAEPAVGTWLTRRGYELRGYENVLGISLGEPSESPSRDAAHITVRESDDREYDTWIDVSVTAFAAQDTQGVPSHESFPRQTLDRILREMADTAGMVRYMALIDGLPVGGASLNQHEGIAQLCGAATLPEYRRRGVQGALLNARLDAARRAGCDVATLSTLPGSKSQENAQKRGFSLLYARAILVRRP